MLFHKALDPKLFLLFANYICNVSNMLEFILYAADTNICEKHENIDMKFLNSQC